jgi:hypothetical protein
LVLSTFQKCWIFLHFLPPEAGGRRPAAHPPAARAGELARGGGGAELAPAGSGRDHA